MGQGRRWISKWDGWGLPGLGYKASGNNAWHSINTYQYQLQHVVNCNHESSMFVWGSFRIPIDAYLFLHVCWVRSRVSFEDIFRCLWPSWKEIETSELFCQLNFLLVPLQDCLLPPRSFVLTRVCKGRMPCRWGVRHLDLTCGVRWGFRYYSKDILRHRISSNKPMIHK